MANCFDCGRPYGDKYGFPDLVIPTYIWREISPTKDESGLLCPSCICQRLHALGKSNIPAAFMSGPITTVSPETMYALRKIENLEERLTPIKADTPENRARREANLGFNQPGFTDANENHVTIGDRVAYGNRFDSTTPPRLGILDDVMQDGDAYVRFEDNNLIECVKFMNLCKVL